MSDRRSRPARLRHARTRQSFAPGQYGQYLRSLPALFAALGIFMAGNANAVDTLGLYELDGDVVNDVVPDNGSITSVLPLANYQVINGRIDVSGNGTIGPEDDGTVNSRTIIDGLVDINTNGTITDSDDGTISGGPLVTYNVYNGFVDISGDAQAPTPVAGDDAMDFLQGPTNPQLFKFFFNTDDTTTVNQSPEDGGNNDITIFQGGSSKDHLAITEHINIAIIDGLVDYDNSGSVTTSDDGQLELIDIINGFADCNNDAVIDSSDNCEYHGIDIIAGRWDVNGNGNITVPDLADDGSTIKWSGGWMWSSGNTQAKNDIYNSWGGTYLYPGPSVGPHLANDFILVYGADVVPSSGAASVSFWFLQDEKVDFIDTVAGSNTFQWMGSHTIGDLLLQTNIAATGSSDLNSSSLAMVWNPGNALCFGGTAPLCPSNASLNGSGSYNNLTTIQTGSNCESISGSPQRFCSLANQTDQPLPAAWPYDHDNPTQNTETTHLRGHMVEGSINLSALYRDLNIPVPCFSKAIAETRTTDSVTGTLTDFSLSGFEACGFEIEKTGDDTAVIGDIVTFSITLRNTGLLPLTFDSIQDPLIDGQAGADTTQRALLAAGCEEIPAQTECTFQVTYRADLGTPNPLINAVTATYLGPDGTPFTADDHHPVDLVYAGSIGDQVWLDENSNGIFDAGEDGIAGVVVTLTPTLNVIAGQGIDTNGDGLVNEADNDTLNGIQIIEGLVDVNNDGVINGSDDGSFQGFTVTDGVVSGTATVTGDIETTITDANGEYVFSLLPAGEFNVTITPPPGMHATFDADGGLDNTTDVTLAEGETNITTDFGLNWVPPAQTDSPTPGATGAIGDRVWNDADGDGIQDAGESGLANVGVVLSYDSDGDGIIDAVYGATVTDATGNYIFDDIPVGTYQVTVVGDVSDPATLPGLGAAIPGALAPSGFTQTFDPDEAVPCTVCDGTTSNPILLAPGDVYLNADFGFQDAPGGVTVRDVSGTVYLDADVDGINDITGGPDTGFDGVTVSLAQEVLIVDGLINLDHVGGADSGILDGVQVIAGALDLDGDGVITAADDGTFNGVAVVDGRLDLDGDGSTGGDPDDTGSLSVIVASTTTDAAGDYLFPGVEPGFYEVIVTDNDVVLKDMYQTGDPDEAGVCVNCDERTSISVTTANVADIDFGYAPTSHEAGEGLISGAVGIDITDNDMIDPGEELTGVDVALFQLFDVISGRVDLDNDGVTNSPATDDNGVLDGYLIIDGLVDFNNDGQIDFNDTGSFGSCGCVFEGLSVSNGNLTTNPTLRLPISTRTTDAIGSYLFGGLDPNGQYSVETVAATLPPGSNNDFDFSGSPTDGVSYVDLSSVPSGIQHDVDFGVEGNNAIGGTIWNDANADGTLTDGTGVTVDETGAGINGVTVALIDADGDILATTNSTGTYLFENLPDGNYSIKVLDDNRLLTGYWLSDGPNDGADNNSQVDPYFLSVSGGETNTTGDFGYYIDDAFVGNTVFFDTNGDGVQDAGESGIAGVPVSLTVTWPTGDSTQVTVVTDSNGEYSFSNLYLDESFSGTGAGQPSFDITVGTGAGSPVEGFLSTHTRPAATDDALETAGAGVDADADNPGGTDAYPERSIGDATNDFGFVSPGSISGLAWRDDNADGVFNGAEPLLSGITVRLFDQDGNPVLDEFGVPLVTATAADGTYIFSDLYPCVGSCSYTVQFGDTVNIVDGLVDRDGDGTTAGDAGDVGMVNGIDLIDGYLDMNDDGVIDDDDDGAFGGYTVIDGWVDVNGTGVDNAGTDLSPGAAAGSASFFSVPNDHEITLQDVGANDAIDSDPDNDSTAAGYGSVSGINVTPGGDVTDVDAGFRVYGTIEGQVFADDPDNGTQGAIDGADAGVRGVVIDLYRDSNNDGELSAGELAAGPVDTTVTDVDGNYLFNRVLLGDYLVSERQPAGFVSLLDESIIDSDQANSDTGDDLIPVSLDFAGDVDDGNNFLEAINQLVAVGDDNNTPMDFPVSGNVLFNDFDPEGDNFDLQGLVIDSDGDGVPDTNADASINNPGGIVIGGTASDGTQISSVDNGGAGAGTLVLNDDGSYTFTPAPGFTGEVLVEYTICDDATPQACDTTTLRISVDPWPDPQDVAGTNSTTANDDEDYSYGETISNDVLSNDEDPEGDAQAVSAWSADTDGDGVGDTALNPGVSTTVFGVDASGTVVVAGEIIVNADGTYTFTPCTDGETPVSDCEAAFQGTVIIDYTATDTNGPPASDQATLTIEVLPEPDEAISGLANPPEQNDPPIAGDDLSLTYMNTPVDGNWLNNDSDPNDAPGVDLADDDLTFEAYDFGATPGSDAPVASLGPIDPDTPETVGPASIGTATTEQGGSIEYFADGTYTYTPPADYVGPDKAIYRVCDESGACDVATIYLVVLPMLDFGDLQQEGNSMPPSSNGNPQSAKFKTTGTGAGRHFILPGLRLGSTVDSEPNGQPSNLADGDGDDEDSTSFDAISPDESVVYRLGVEVTNNRALDAIVTGWLDLNCDLDFDDPGERATGRATTATHDAAGNPLANASYSQTTSPVVGSGWDGPTANRDIRGQVVAASSGTQIVGLEWFDGGNPLISQSDVDNDCTQVDGTPRMYSRIRVTSDRGLASGAGNRANSNFFSNASPTPSGPTRDGEIEDHMVTLDISTTPALVVELQANSEGVQGAEVSWLTASELGAAAFRLERWVDSGRAGHWQRVHPQAWVPALLALQGGHYQVHDPEVREGETHRYRVMEQASKGSLIQHGPFEVTVDTAPSPLNTGSEDYSSRERWDIDRVIALSDQRASAPTRAQSVAPTRMQAGPGGKNKSASGQVKLHIAETGIYGIPVSTLAGYFGLSVATTLDYLKAGQFSLSTGGEKVSWHADELGTFYFFGEAIDSLYGAHRIYWLAERVKGRTMGIREVTGAGDAPQPVQIASVDFEQEQFAFLTSTSNPADDYWFWDFMYALNGFRERQFDVTLPDQRADAGEMQVRMFGNSDVTHTVRIQVNGIDVAPVQFAGAVPFVATVALPAEVFADGGEAFSVKMKLDNSPDGLSSVFLDGFEVTYVRGFEAHDNRILFSADQATELLGFDSGSIAVMDVTAPRKPTWIAGGSVEPGASYAYHAELPLGEYAAAASAGLHLPEVVTPDVPSDLASRNNRADYVIITTDALWAGAEALAAYRSGEFITKVVNQTDVFDEFAHGLPDPAAIRELIRSSRTWKVVPRYFVLLGDGSFDYQDRLGTGYNQVGPMMFGTRQGLHASDTMLGDVDGSGRPTVPVGRIPAKTVQEALAYVSKLAAYETNALMLPALTLTDRPDQGGQFTQSGKLIARAIEGEQVALGLQDNTFGDVKDALFEELNRGKRLVNYIGHGGTDRISKLGNGLLNNNDADTGLKNAFTPALVGLSCLINNYSVPGWDSLGERLVLRPDAGMIASWAASGESYNLEASLLGIRFNEKSGQHERLGDAIMDALSQDAVLTEVYTLLGDPALRLQSAQ